MKWKIDDSPKVATGVKKTDGEIIKIHCPKCGARCVVMIKFDNLRVENYDFVFDKQWLEGWCFNIRCNFSFDVSEYYALED